MILNRRQEKRIVTFLREKIPDLKALYLFGSYADGSANRESDVDIAFLADSAPESLQKWEIAQDLARELSIDVDLIDLKTTNTIFRYQILSTGKRIYGGGFEVESFETLAYSFYLRFQEERKPIIDAFIQSAEVKSA